MNASGRARCEWAGKSHWYLSGEMRVGEITDRYGVRTPIMPLPSRFHGDVGGPWMHMGLIWVGSLFMGPPPLV